ncbi:MAG: glycosyltransferase family 2 protein [Bacillota bacterium]|nr:glycosyltransferase family 2 protein [Bacillota bacterium]
MNKNIALNIQILQYREEQGKYYFSIKGWGFSKKGHPLQYKIFINSKEHDFSIKTINREEVQHTYKEYIKISEVGFSILVECEEKPNHFEMLAYDGDEAEHVRLSKRQIQKFLQKDNIDYSIDAFEYLKDSQEYTYTFWAYDVHKKPLQVSVEDAQGKEVSIKIEVSARLDLMILDMVGKENKKCGYKIRFKGDMNELYTLVLKTEDEEQRILLQKNPKLSDISYSRLWLLKRRVLNYIHTKGLKNTFLRIRGKEETDWKAYARWFEATKVSEEELAKQRAVQFAYAPKISIIVATFNTKESYLKEMIDSVVEQSYSNWELCIGDGSTNDSVEKYVKKHYAQDSRIRFKRLEKNYGISGNMNGALELVTGEYVGLFDHDDLLTPDCLYEIVASLQEVRHDVIYTDEDKLDDENKVYLDPHFKPDFSPEQLCSHNYITHFFVVDMDIVRKVGGLREEYDGSQDHDFIFRCTEVARSIHHIPKILYHWRMHMASTAANPESKMYCYTSGKKAIEAHYERMGYKANVEMLPFPFYGMYKSTFETPGNPLVSIIIPNKDLKETLENCIQSLVEVNSYKNFEVIIVENNSTTSEIFDYYDQVQKMYSNVKVVTWKDSFNYSLINNFGVQYAQGDYLLFLNNDTELIEPDSISHMLGYCMRDDIGCVGAKLLYEDNTIQHCGVIVGYRGYAVHPFIGVGRNGFGYMGRPIITSNYSAVTAACLMVKKADFEAVNGFDPQFVVACNDVDFCLKVRELGKYNIEDVFSLWYHYESKTRGLDIEGEAYLRFQGEIKKFQEKWPKILKEGDPFYNKNYDIDEVPFTYPHV